MSATWSRDHGTVDSVTAQARAYWLVRPPRPSSGTPDQLKLGFFFISRCFCFSGIPTSRRPESATRTHTRERARESEQSGGRAMAHAAPSWRRPSGRRRARRHLSAPRARARCALRPRTSRRALLRRLLGFARRLGIPLPGLLRLNLLEKRRVLQDVGQHHEAHVAAAQKATAQTPRQQGQTSAQVSATSTCSKANIFTRRCTRDNSCAAATAVRPPVVRWRGCGWFGVLRPWRAC